MALDFRLVNDCTVKQHYPLPHVQQCLDAMGKAKYFTTLDCISAFWNIPVSKTTQELTAVNFPWGKFAFTGMPMGMQAASAHYQRSMDLLLGHLQPRIAISYIDDICIFSNTWAQHMLDVATVIDRVGGAGFKFKPSKCRIGKSTAKFLGYEVSGDGCVRTLVRDRVSALGCSSSS